MLRGLCIVVSPVLILLLAVLSPVGTGQGAHRDQLLDPLFPHIHLAGGLTTSQSTAMNLAQRQLTGEQHGPAFGAGAGAASTALSPGLTPPVPARVALAPSGAALAWAVLPMDAVPPGALADPPPDPPPTAS